MFNFVVSSKDFVGVTQHIIKGALKEPSGVLYMNIVQQESKNQLEMICMTGTSYFAGKIDISSMSANEVPVEFIDGWGVDVQHISPILQILPKIEMEVKFEQDKTNRRTLNLKFDKSSLRISTIGGITANREEDILKLGEVDSSSFFDVIDKISKVVEAEVNVDVSSACLHLKVENDKLTIMGTNRAALSEIVLPFKPLVDITPTTYLIRRSQLPLLINPIFEGGKIVISSIKKHRIGYIDEAGNHSFVSHVNLDPINYRFIIDERTSPDYNITVFSSPFKSAFAAITKLLPTSAYVWLKAENGVLYVESETQDRLDIPLVDPITVEFSLKFPRPKFSGFFSLLTDKTKIYIPKKEKLAEHQMIKFAPLSDDDSEIDNVYIGVITLL